MDTYGDSATKFFETTYGFIKRHPHIFVFKKGYG